MTRPKRQGESLKAITILLPGDVLARVQGMAERTVTPPSVLLRQWIMERLDRSDERNGEAGGTV